MLGLEVDTLDTTLAAIWEPAARVDNRDGSSVTEGATAKFMASKLAIPARVPAGRLEPCAGRWVDERRASRMTCGPGAAGYLHDR